MPVEEVRLGPFIGGLNLFSDATAIGDTEVSELVNFELDLDGSLVNRPPIVRITGSEIPGSSGTGIDVLGFFEVSGGAKFLVASNRNNATYYFNGATWVLITDTIAAAAITQFRGELWLVAGPASVNPGGRWTGPGGTFTADANMPKGGCAVSFKDRIWIGPGADATVNAARLYLSNVVTGAGSPWPVTPNFLNIGQGDGESIIDVGIYYESLIIFKQGSTFRYSFSTDPSLGTVTRISENIGAVAKGCYASYENQLFVLFDNKVYEFTNYLYNQLNTTVPLFAENPSSSLAESTSISVWADRLFVQYYDTTYVYSLKTKTWSVWSSTDIDFMGRFWAIPGQQGTMPTAYTYRAAKTGFLGLYTCKDIITASDTEAMTCSMATKNYDYMTAGRFKRLISWGVDCISKVLLKGEVKPIVYGQAITWQYMVDNNITWQSRIDQMLTWDNPVNASIAVDDIVQTIDAGTGRKFVRFLKSLRFRQVQFRLSVETQGNLATAPVRIYSITTRVSEKNTVPRKVN